MRAALYLPGYFFIAFATWFLAGVLPCSAQDAAWLRRPWKQDITIPAGWYQGPEGHGGEADIWTEDKFAIIWKEGSLVENAVFRQGTSARMEVKRCHFRKVIYGAEFVVPSGCGGLSLRELHLWKNQSMV
jgi:hypothetical protein